MKRDQERLEELAGRVSDGFEVDWERAEGEFGPTERGTARHLRKVDEIARGYRQLDESGDGSGQIWGPLEVIELIGSGAFSRVYRARDPQLERQVALKLHRNREAADLVVSEARRLSRVRHPNVLTIHGADVVDGQPGIWTELVEGETLADRLRRQGPMGEGEVLQAALELCRALAAVHGAGIIHRDIKAQNVMREVGGRLVLMDFGTGLASDREEARGPSGTPLYMAPELFHGDPASAESDIYALGVLLFHLLTGRFPVEGDSIRSLRVAHEQGQRKHLRDLRPELSDSFLKVIDQAIDPESSRRFPSAGAMGQALARSMDHSASGGGERSRHPRLWSIVAIVLAGAAIAAGFWFLQTQSPPTAYSVDAGLVRVTAEGAEPVVSGATVHPGDRLYLEFESTRELHVYILNRDERGEAYLLFPLPEQDLANPLPAGQRLRIPGTRGGEELFWQVTSAGGLEHFLLIASPDPLTDFEGQIAELDRPRIGRPITASPIGTEVLRSLRGVGGLSAAVPSAGSAQDDLFESALSLATHSGTTTGVWVRKVELLNP